MIAHGGRGVDPVPPAEDVLHGDEGLRGAGVEDSDERLYDDVVRAGGGENDPRLVNVYIKHQREAYAWLKQIGMTFKAVELSSAQSVPRTHPLDAVALMARVRELADQSGRIATIVNAPVERLLRNAESAAVDGVMARIDGAPLNVRARRGVVLAAGGFSRNEQMLKDFVPNQANGIRYGGAGNVGDGLRMAWALGAGFRDMGYVKGTFGYHPDARTKPGRDWTKLPVYRGAIAVNKLGRRYVDESKSYKLLGDAVLQQPDALAYQIFDQDIMDSAADGVPPFDFRSTVRRGLVFEAATLADLARKIGLDPAQLTATVQRYNGFVENGVDEEFGRDGLATHYGKLRKIERAPFYAYPSGSGIIATYCGLTVDTETRVLDVFGEPIARLFAAGELMGGFHGVAYMTGSALGKCVIFGGIAGRNAARVT